MHTSCVQGAGSVGTSRGGEESGLHAGSLSDIRGRPRHAESSVSVHESISVAAALERRPRRDDESGSLTQEDSQEMFRRE